MWQVLTDHFKRYPAQERVIRLMIQHGLRIHKKTVWCGDIELTDTAVARSAGVDRRIVAATVETVLQNPALHAALERFVPTLHLKDAAPYMGCGVLEITATDAHRHGILAGISRIIADAGISIRQAVVEDADFTDTPLIYVVTQTPLPAHLIPELQRVAGIRSVTVRAVPTLEPVTA